MEISEIPVEKIFKSIILDSLMKDEFIRKRQSTENFFSRNEYLLTGAAIVAGAALGPLAVTGLVAALGFGEAGIAAGSIAAWMMSLQGGTVAAGSLVATLQSVGAAGLGIGGVITAVTGGSVAALWNFDGFYGFDAIAKAILIISESNSEKFAKMENFVSINESDDYENLIDDCSIIFSFQPLLDSNENEKLKSFLRGFDLAREVANDRAKKFEFLVIRDDESCREGIEISHQHLIKINGNNCVTSEPRSFVLNLNNL
ncbi:6628_t:CDS:2 [Funneliformis caledonium]|uniref:6628_t:CDS:1 n=1 Tax=Funneliformis caledonium TaxID=1117310 RepID=A0A9N8Z8K9_9GLOM|nr:6628_t:CDS:2 [Funneliformis caledonium]